MILIEYFFENSPLHIVLNYHIDKVEEQQETMYFQPVSRIPGRSELFVQSAIW